MAWVSCYRIMLLPFVSLLLAFGLCIPSGISGSVSGSKCSSSIRITGAKQIPYAYNLVASGASAQAFQEVPFAQNCKTYINPDGLGNIEVAVGGTSTYDFAVLSRQVFSKVTGEYVDHTNGTTVIKTNVTLGLLHGIALPVTFSANVYLFYELKGCTIEKIVAYATIPTVLFGYPVPSPYGGICGPINCQKFLDTGCCAKKNC